MDIFDEEFLNFWRSLNKYNVKYIMVGVLIPGWTNFSLNNGFRLDLMVNMKGLEEFSFDECYEFSNKANIDDVIVPFLHINHLIANKRAVNRPKDQLDVLELERIKEYLKKDKQDLPGF